MRPQQQNRRMRGRNNNNNNNNRKGPNPLTRSYESNGPDVKIRGSAQQIADKYLTLARDAQSSGDRVMAENYLQHAEHYNRIIAAAQAQMPQQQQMRDMRDDFEDDDEDRDDAEQAAAPENQNQSRQQGDGSGPQPYINGTPAEVALTGEGEPGETEQPREQRAAGYSNGNGHEANEGEEGGQRRPRRSRRGRGRSQDRGFDGEQAAGTDEGQPSEGQAAESQPAAAPESEVSDTVG